MPNALLKPVGPLEMNSRGFISPFGREEKEQFSHRIEEHLWLTVGGEDKILPGAVVNDLLERKLEEIESNEGRRPGGRERKRMKDDLLHELLPRAFVRTRATMPSSTSSMATSRWTAPAARPPSTSCPTSVDCWAVSRRCR